jgi:peptidoglycan hydrolase-like protein with peptidoglycan-binding domain
MYAHTANAQTTITVSSSLTSGSTPTTLSALETELATLEGKLTAAKTVASGSTSSSSSGYTFSTYLYPGVTSNDVTELQTILTQQGLYSGPITGYYGSLTKSAVIALQAAHGLDQLGVVGPATRALLNTLQNSGSSAGSNTSGSSGDGYKFKNPLDVGSTGKDVTELQKRLTAEGLYSGPITGYYGSLTQAAVETYQGDHDLNQLGNVGPGTRADLNSGL